MQLRIQAGVVTFFGLPGTKQENMPVFFDGNPEDFNAEECEEKYREKMNKNEIPNDYLNQADAEDVTAKLI